MATSWSIRDYAPGHPRVLVCATRIWLVLRRRQVDTTHGKVPEDQIEQLVLRNRRRRQLFDEERHIEFRGRCRDGFYDDGRGGRRHDQSAIQHRVLEDLPARR